MSDFPTKTINLPQYRKGDQMDLERATKFRYPNQQAKLTMHVSHQIVSELAQTLLPPGLVLESNH